MSIKDTIRNAARETASAAWEKAGGSGAVPVGWIDKAFSTMVRDLDAEASEIDFTEVRSIPTATPTPAATPEPLLIDGGHQTKYRSMKSIDGREHMLFERNQKLSDHYGQPTGLNLEGLGDALAAMITGDPGRCRAEVRSLNSSTNSAGGIMVGEELSAQIVDLARAKAVVFQAGAVTIPMASSDLRLVRVKTDSTVSQLSEGAAISESDSSFNSILLVAKKLGCLTSVTNELLSDAGNAGAVIVDSLASAMASAIDDYVLNSLFDSTEIGTEASVGSIAYQDLLKGMLDVRLLNGEATGIICNPNLPYDLSLLTEATTNAFMAPPAQLAGLTFYESTRCADTHAIMGDFSQCIVGMRQGITIELSRDAGFSYDKTMIRALARLDSAAMRPHFRILAGIS